MNNKCAASGVKIVYWNCSNRKRLYVLLNFDKMSLCSTISTTNKIGYYAAKRRILFFYFLKFNLVDEEIAKAESFFYRLDKWNRNQCMLLN